MPYTPSTTWIAGERLDAVETQDNLDGLKVYTQQTDAAGYVGGAAFIEPQHIIKPFIDSIRTATHCVSGFYAAQHSRGLFVSGSFMSRFEADSNDRMAIPHTSLNLPIARACNIFYQLWAATEMRTDGSATRGNGYLEVYLGDLNSLSSQLRSQMPEQAAGEPLSCSGRRFSNVYHSLTLPTAQTYKIGVAGYGGANVQLVNWGFTVEVFYL